MSMQFFGESEIVSPSRLDYSLFEAVYCFGCWLSFAVAALAVAAAAADLQSLGLPTLSDRWRVYYFR